MFHRFVNSPLIVSKVLRDCTDFASPRSVIGPENSRHSLNQSDAKLKPNTTCSPAFPRAIGYLVDFLSFHWPLQVFSFHRIGRRDYFGFVLMTLNRKAL